MNASGFRIGVLAAFMLVVLRVSLGWHFLSEGIWKYQHPDFSAEGFLRQARGPFAEKFHALIPDYDGLGRLDQPKVTESWDQYRSGFRSFYSFTEEQVEEAGRIYDAKAAKLEAFFKEHSADIEAYRTSLEELKQQAATDPTVRDVPFQQKRHHDKQTKLRAQSAGWLAEVDRLEADFKRDLDELRSPEQVKLGRPIGTRSTLDTINLATTYGFIAIGACLMVGLFTRLASLGGGLFLASVVMAQLALPNIYYPPLHPSAGHSLVVNKEFIEMIALFALAVSPVGRWGGLDFLIHNLFFRNCCSGKGK